MYKINILKRKFIPATCSHESELLHCVVTPPIDSAWSSYLTGFQGQLLKVLPRVSFPWALAFTACKHFVYGKRFCVCFEVKKSIWEHFRRFLFSRRQNMPLITLITVRHTGPSEAFFVARNSVPKSTILFS